MALYGGFPTGGGSRDPNTYQTSLSGDINIPDNNSDNSYHVTTGSGTNSTAVLDGFTITRGYANGSSLNGYGAGMYNSSGSPTVTNCIFSSNSASSSGGMSNDNSSPTVTNCTFSNNSATYSGGGIYNLSCSPTITNCIFSSNSATAGGGMHNRDNSSPIVTNCTFNDNSATAQGGGMYNYSYSSPTVTNCTFTDNSVASGGFYGGGMCNLSSCNPTVTNCAFAGNSAPKGGGMDNTSSSPTLTKCTFADNSADYGGGMYDYASSSPTITNCTIVNNSATNGPVMACDSYNQSSPSTVVMLNCIVWNGTDWLWNNDQSAIVITYSDVQGGCPGLGNIDTDPCFVEADANDYHLKSEGWRWDIARQRWDYDDVTSRCIDAGNPGSPLGDELLSVPHDLDNEWGQNLRIDMGAFGGTAEASIPPYDWALLSDVTNDGISNYSDIDILSSLWLNSGEQLYADFNRDGIIDLSDFALLAQDWLGQTSWR